MPMSPEMRARFDASRRQAQQTVESSPLQAQLEARRKAMQEAEDLPLHESPPTWEKMRKEYALDGKKAVDLREHAVEGWEDGFGPEDEPMTPEQKLARDPEYAAAYDAEQEMINAEKDLRFVIENGALYSTDTVGTTSTLINKELASKLSAHLTEYEESDAARVYATEAYTKARDAYSELQRKYDSDPVIRRILQDKQTKAYDRYISIFNSGKAAAA